jgi:hypothetical protein
MKRLIFAAAAALLASAGLALAQSSPGLVFGQVPTAGQWNSYFAAKQDVLGYTAVNRAGDTMTGKLTTFASQPARAGFSLPQGTAPTTPSNGDVWTTSAGLFVRINGTTVGPLLGGGGNVTGPGSATDEALARYDGTTGKLLQNSTVTISDAGVVAPTANDGGVLGAATLGWGDLFGATGFTWNIGNGNWLATHSSGVMTVTTGDLRMGTAGTNSASVVTVGGTQTLTGKTLTTPVISSISNSGTLTLPASTDTLVGRNTADTLTNKTLTTPTITLKQSAGPTPTVSGDIQWDTAANALVIGNGGGQTTIAAAITTSFVAYTPTFTGFGTVTGIDIWSRRVGDSLEIRGRFTCGTSTAVEARMTLGFNGVNGGLTINATKVSANQLSGYWTRSTATAIAPSIVAQTGTVGYITFGFQDGTAGGLTTQNGNNLCTSPNAISLTAEVPITGW